jgi:hypothetical protein
MVLWCIRCQELLVMHCFLTSYIFKFLYVFLQIYLYGGYFKEVSSDKEKGTVHADMWSLDPRTWEWNKVDTYIYIIILNVISVNFYLSVYLCPRILY